MRIGVLLLGIAVFVGAAYGVVSMLKGYQVAQRQVVDSHMKDEHAGHSAAEHRKPPDLKKRPKVSETPPWPKAVLDRTEFDFGRMEVGEELEHDFVIRNEGEADLELVQGDTTCQCTISQLEGDRIPAGQSAKITLRWHPTQQSDTFEKGAEIRTNDPQNSSIHLKIIGMVAPRFVTNPPEIWEIREYSDSGPNKTTGYVFSPIVEDLQITRLIYDENRMTVSVREADPEAIGQMRSKSAIAVDVEVKPGLAVGTFSLPLKLVTNAQERKADGKLGSIDDPAVLEVRVIGRREGPIRILGNAYIAEEGVVVLGSFSVDDGKSVSLTLLVREAPEEGLRILSCEADPESIEVQIDPVGKAVGTAIRHTMTFKIPPGTTRMVRRNEVPATVKIKTNHPLAPEMVFQVHFTSY
ncbi:MAG: DUF1573 domain-containing protein [Planctomycetaceae bacterium]|nr:MAG: DUF1573 domain-containing protein [Planctomycetaceae bacterium]